MWEPDQLRAIVERGRRASSLMADASFLWIVDDQTNHHLSALVAARPGPASADAVAYHHNQIHAITDLVGTLKGYAEAGEAAQRAIEAPNEDNDV